MSIRKIEIGKFTVFNNITVESCKGINVIIGDNGTGKTHLLKLIYAVWLRRDDEFFKFERLFSENGNLTKFSYTEDSLDDNHYRLDIGNDEANEYRRTAVIESSDLYTPLFIPAKEMLSMSNITRIDDKFSKELAIDITLTDIIRKAQTIKPDETPLLAEKIAIKLERIIDGKVFVKADNSFWVRKNDQKEISFSMEAEGFRKFGLLWQLIMNESIRNGTVLLWDEPEANINPRLIPDLVKIMLELSRNGVQIFIATHDYFLAKYIEVLSNPNDAVAFHSLHKTGEGVKCESDIKFSTLINNEIIAEKIRLYEAEIEKVSE